MTDRKSKILIAFLGWVGGAKRGDHQALRDTWLKDISQFPQIDYKFFIGDGSPLTPEDEIMINEGWEEWAIKGNTGHADNQINLGNLYPSVEYEPQDDELMIPYPDGYKYLSYKRRESCRWALERGYDYIFGASVDVYSRLDRLISSDFQKYDYHGMFCGNTGYQGTKSYIPESYIFGGGYWLSAKAMQIIADSPVTYWCEDWWIGMALANAVKNKQIIRKDAPLTVSKYCLPPRYPNISNDIISVELSAGNYNNETMHACHKQFNNPVTKPIQRIVTKQVTVARHNIVHTHTKPIQAPVKAPIQSSTTVQRYGEGRMLIDRFRRK